MENQRLNVLSYGDYRQLIRDLLRFQNYSYRSFTERNPGLISFGMLSAALSMGRSGLKNRPARTLSVELICRLGKSLKLNDEELSHLLLLKLENDAEAFRGLHGAALQGIARKLIQRGRIEMATSSASKLNTRKDSYSSLSLTTADILDALPENARVRISLEILPLFKAVIARQRGKPGIRSLLQKVKLLEELTREGI